MHFNFMDPPQTLKQARLEYPGCVVFVEVAGGWAGFESMEAFELWENQK